MMSDEDKEAMKKLVTEMLVEALDDVTALVDLAALNGGGYAEGVADRPRQRLGTIDDGQPGHRRVEPPADEIVEQSLDGRGVLRRSLVTYPPDWY